LKVKVSAAGALTNSMPSGKDIVEGENLTVQSLLETLVSKYGSRMARELMSQGRLREGLVLLINGRNVLSLPEKYETLLKEGDELLVTIMVAGG
jgi:molybdopterin converting factor small subunit